MPDSDADASCCKAGDVFLSSSQSVVERRRSSELVASSMIGATLWVGVLLAAVVFRTGFFRGAISQREPDGSNAFELDSEGRCVAFDCDVDINSTTMSRQICRREMGAVVKRARIFCVRFHLSNALGDHSWPTCVVRGRGGACCRTCWSKSVSPLWS